MLCWGRNDGGQLGLGDVAAVIMPTQVGSDNNWSELNTGAAHNCAVRAGQVYCWGDNHYGQAGVDNSNAAIRTPSAVAFR